MPQAASYDRAAPCRPLAARRYRRAISRRAVAARHHRFRDHQRRPGRPRRPDLFGGVRRQRRPGDAVACVARQKRCQCRHQGQWRAVREFPASRPAESLASLRRHRRHGHAAALCARRMGACSRPARRFASDALASRSIAKSSKRATSAPTPFSSPSVARHCRSRRRPSPRSISGAPTQPLGRYCPAEA